MHPSTCSCLICRTGNNNYIRCGQVFKSVAIWDSDTTTCKEKQLAVCLQEELPDGGASRGARKDSFALSVSSEGSSVEKGEECSSEDKGEITSDGQIQ